MQEPQKSAIAVPRRAIDLSPKAIVQHNALTVREKIELLEDIRLQLGGDVADGAAEFGTADIDKALGELRQMAATGKTDRLTTSEPARKMAGGRF
ncbi:hypothetical protein SAMN02983003_3424 [Devosia enhydra]|uniref:Uncharacterized protein n=1 Tax=Devosia enhydra TaxID=665118 RepID=A0A1K2I1I2_9HYPH|nr:hypothetical protein [Devosia enhydra]SFZ86246.1 hypothetical protein SAMN02983003_3424 [Devosia enhydra]